uniref:Uncharacterized protein n=1 Tax=Phocoena sinus TaxID=42100 RepID=A0A8C9BJE5_PHOSS
LVDKLRPHPPLLIGQAGGAGGGGGGGHGGSRPLRSGHRQRIQIWTKSGQRHPSPTATAMPAGRTTEIQTTTPAKPSKWRY